MVSGGVTSSPSITANTLVPVPSHTLPCVSQNSASLGARVVRRMQRHDVLGVARRLEPASAPRSFRGHGTGASVAVGGHGDCGAAAIDHRRRGAAAIRTERTGAAGDGEAHAHVGRSSGAADVDDLAHRDQRIRRPRTARPSARPAATRTQSHEVLPRRRRDRCRVGEQRLEHAVADREAVVEHRQRRHGGIEQRAVRPRRDRS